MMLWDMFLQKYFKMYKDIAKVIILLSPRRLSHLGGHRFHYFSSSQRGKLGTQVKFDPGRHFLLNMPLSFIYCKIKY